MENLKPISETEYINFLKIDGKTSRERETWRIAGAQDPIFFAVLREVNSKTPQLSKLF